MTLHFPDLSNNRPNLSLAGAPALIAKATEGTDFTDVEFIGYKAKAEHLGIPFLAYHYLHHGDAPGQAMHAAAVVGTGQPLMLDVEEVWIIEDHKKVRLPDPTLADTLDFMDAWPGTVSLVYLPHWFWSGNWNSPSLSGIASRGAGLVSSSYTDYSDTGPGWEPYGGMTPIIWQYTDRHPFHDKLVDFNAFKGSADQLRALFEGDSMTPDELIAAVKKAAYDLANSVTHPVTATDRNYRNDLWAAQLAADGFAHDEGATPGGSSGVLKARLDAIDETLADIKAALQAHIGGGGHP